MKKPLCCKAKGFFERGIIAQSLRIRFCAHCFREIVTG